MVARKLFTLFVFGLVLILLQHSQAHATITFDWAKVGNAGNAADVDTGYGAVSYDYLISKSEVTNTQYAEFLNAVDPMGTNALALYNPDMSANANGGIEFDYSAADGLKYQVKSGRGNNPVVFVSFLDAMRFANWLQNGQGNGSTESGVYMIGNGLNEARNVKARYFIPNENEWYKAAYHKNDGVTSHYWYYPTSSDREPYSAQPPGTGAPTQSNTANIYALERRYPGYNDGFAVTGSLLPFNSLQNYLTDVGAYSTSVSPYGTFDQGGNVWELNEAIVHTTYGGLRGGGWWSDPGQLSKGWRGFYEPFREDRQVGFRIAGSVVPEPSGCILAIGAFAVAYGQRSRK